MKRKQSRRCLNLGAAVVLLLTLTGCDFTVQPLGGAEGRTLVYVAVGKQGAPNAGIICTRIGAIVIDPMLTPTCGDALNSQAEAKNRIFWDNLWATKKQRPQFMAPPVLYVLNTTFRASHTFGNQSFPKADVISTARAKERLEQDATLMRAELRDVWRVPGLENHATTPATITVDEGAMNLDTPDIKVKFVAMGDCVGEGDAVVYLPVQKVLFAGDMVLPGYVPYHKGRSLTVRNWIQALKRMEAWEVDTVVPGHGEVTKKDGIVQQREFLEALVAEVEQALKAGKDQEQTVAAVKLAKYASWQHYGDWLSENVKLVYRELKNPAAEAKSTTSGAGAVKPVGMDRADGFRDK